MLRNIGDLPGMRKGGRCLFCMIPGYFSHRMPIERASLMPNLPKNTDRTRLVVNIPQRTAGGYAGCIYPIIPTREAMLGVYTLLYPPGRLCWVCTPLYIHQDTMPGMYIPVYTPLYTTLGTPAVHHHHDRTGVRCMQRRPCVREEALGSSLRFIRYNEAHRALLSPIL